MSSIRDYVVGVCHLMCPENERALRERENLLHPLEILETDTKEETSLGRRNRSQILSKADVNKTVKCFSRSAAGQKAPDPADLRPAPVLMQTVDYLVFNVACKDLGSFQWVERYNFVADRLRAVRQDMVIQGLPAEDCVKLLGPMVKFHVFSAYWLCERDIKDFDPVLNRTFLRECIKSLLIMYDSLTEDSVSIECVIKEGCEESFCGTEQHLMEALYLAINLGDPAALRRSLQQKRIFSESYCHCIQQRVTDISLAWYCGSYVSVCRSLKNLPLLVTMACVLQLSSIRRYALTVMNTAYSSKILKVPTTYLQEILLWSSETDVIRECSHYGIECSKAVDDLSCVSFLKGKFRDNTKLFPCSRVPWLDTKINEEILTKLFSSQE